MLTPNDIIWKDGIKDFLENKRKLIEKNENIILFGSARGGQRVYEFLCQCGMEKRIVSIIDNDQMKQGKMFHGIKIMGAESLKEKKYDFNNSIVVIASGSSHIIMKQLEEYNIPDEKKISFAISNLQINPTPFEFFVNQKSQINRVYELLEDEKSKNTFISLLNYKMTQDTGWLIDIAEDEHDQYFDEVMRINDKESFVDCGAFIGDTLDEYRYKTGGKWKAYYCFEADPDVFVELKNHIEKLGLNVKIYNVGCWNKKEKLYFEKQGSGSSSIVETDGGVSIEADRIDEILSGKTVSIIKMDIEGAEQKALEGAKCIISQQHPRLAISIYHSLEDYLNIPEVLFNFGNEYKIYIRHYRKMSDSETICYAV